MGPDREDLGGEGGTVSAVLHVLCAGAVKGLVTALQGRFAEMTGASVDGRFGAVGAMKEALQRGEPCDVMIVTAPMIEALAASGELRGATRVDLGRVRTGVAVRAGAAPPDITTVDNLRLALLEADALYFPDPERATAGIHFAKLMRELGIHDRLAARFRTFPNGATAMRELADSGTPYSLGCTQITEINYTEGVSLVGALPDPFELSTVYSAAVTQQSAQPTLASTFVALLSGARSRPLRQAGGFEFHD
jgi:molybdate transport system substrate-binding protein